MRKIKNDLLDRFIRYVKIDTMSEENTGVTPSTQKQFELAKLLVKELESLGLTDVKLSDHCFVTAVLPSNIDNNNLSIGFIAHMDTIPGFSGTNVKPQVFENYNGNAIHLKGIDITPNQFPFLEKLKGKTLITTDGTTVLGADDKAGIAIIMSMLQHFKTTNEPHVEIRVAFTPDEEIGEGIGHFNLKDFPCDFAYTIDGGAFDEINYENFNASSAIVHVKGLDIHPGSAKNQMKNASNIAMEFNASLPAQDRPEYTDGYDGFYHLTEMSGTVGEATLHYILRNHNLDFLRRQEMDFKNARDFLNNKYGKDTITVQLKDSYFNMASLIKKDPRCVEKAMAAITKLGFTPQTSPIRGGTDGARLTHMGLNTPNLGTGGYNCHGPYELACLEEMENVCNILIEIATK